MLRRLKALGADVFDLKEVYEKQVRSVLEFGTPVFTSGLTCEDENNIERVQRTVASIILGVYYTSYSEALQILCLQTLKVRRLETCTKFAKKSFYSGKFSSWFQKSELKNNENDRLCKEMPEITFLKTVKTRTKRYKKSPIPYLTNLINQCQND